MNIIKKIVVFIFILALILSFAACSDDNKNDNNEEFEKSIELPFVISHNSIVLKNGMNVFVDIEMVDGSFFIPDVLGGGIYENNWQGQYKIRVYQNEDNQKEFYYEPIFVDSMGNEQMNFGGEFALVFDDYNNDGNPDFTLGQFGNSNGNYYNLFSIDDGNVIKYQFENDLYISKQEFSIGLEKLSSTSFTYSFYNNAESEYIERIYEWDGVNFNMVQ